MHELLRAAAPEGELQEVDALAVQVPRHRLVYPPAVMDLIAVNGCRAEQRRDAVELPMC